MGQIVGIDTSIWIYLLEGNAQYHKSVQAFFQSVEAGKIESVFSCIGLIEILTGPKQLGQLELAAKYKELITNFPHLAIRGMNERIVDTSSDLRGLYGISTPDAIHLATAIYWNADYFLTNDKRLRKVREISVKLLK